MTVMVFGNEFNDEFDGNNNENTKKNDHGSHKRASQ